MDYRGIEYLRTKLAQKKQRAKLRYKFYDMKNVPRDLRISTPPNLEHMWNALGWCGKAVDSLADRIVFREFGQDTFGLNEIVNLNNKDVLFDGAVASALISSCCFIYVSSDESGFPRLQAIDGSRATGIIDPITYMLTEGYAVLEEDDYGKAVLEAYFIKGKTHYIRDGKLDRIVPNTAPYPLLVPVIFRPDPKRQFGHSRISRACMDIVTSALRTIKRSEISAEFYSFPQKYVLGTSQDAEPIDKWRASMSFMMEFTKDNDGDRPVVGQFVQQTMTPHFDQLRLFASLFAGETGLTLDDLGFPTENPSSSEAIKAAHENLRLTARKAQRTFGVGFLNACYLGACLRDGISYERTRLYDTKLKWEPVFEADASALSSYGDGAIKINQAIPGYFDKESLRDITGIDPSRGVE